MIAYALLAWIASWILWAWVRHVRETRALARPEPVTTIVRVEVSIRDLEALSADFDHEARAMSKAYDIDLTREPDEEARRAVEWLLWDTRPR